MEFFERRTGVSTFLFPEAICLSRIVNLHFLVMVIFLNILSSEKSFLYYKKIVYYNS